MYIPIVLGTAREERESEKVWKLVQNVASESKEITFESVDVRDYGFTHTEPAWIGSKKAKPWREIVTKADGFVLVSPEYNRGYPGELKLLLDSAYEEYFYKPVLIVSVSSGAFAGVRMAEHIKSVLIELRMVPLQKAIHVPRVEEWGESDEVQDKFKKDTRDALDTLLIYAQHLAPLRRELHERGIK